MNWCQNSLLSSSVLQHTVSVVLLCTRFPRIQNKAFYILVGTFSVFLRNSLHCYSKFLYVVLLQLPSLQAGSWHTDCLRARRTPSWTTPPSPQWCSATHPSGRSASQRVSDGFIIKVKLLDFVLCMPNLVLLWQTRPSKPEERRTWRSTRLHSLRCITPSRAGRVSASWSWCVWAKRRRWVICSPHYKKNISSEQHFNCCCHDLFGDTWLRLPRSLKSFLCTVFLVQSNELTLEWLARHTFLTWSKAKPRAIRFMLHSS